MGWLWSSGSNSTDKLDQSLQDFLKKEAPTGPKPALPIAPKEPPAQTPPPPTTATTSQTQTEPEKPSIPPQSQFQDGRYAHLWKGYTPQDVLLDRSKSEQDRLRDLVDSYNDRRSGIGRVAMENCALEYMEQFDCFRNPKTWWSRGTMCQAESRKFNRCHDLQSKFLKALGYLTLDARSQEEDEKIQMHADKLYQQLMAHEAEIEKAKNEGRPEPQFDSLMAEIEKSRSLLRASMQPKATAKGAKSNPEEDGDVWSRLKPEIKKEYEKKLSELPPDERDIERMAVLGELKAQTGISKKVEQTFIEERIARMKRREEGKQTIGDTIKYWWGWG